MEKIIFTTKVLGPIASYRLENFGVTQTIRSESSSIVGAILSGRIKVGDQIQIFLDDRMIELAQFVIMDSLLFDMLDEEDAHRGGFDSVEEMATALKRAGYRFKPVNSYWFHRIQFTWKEKEYA